MRCALIDHPTNDADLIAAAMQLVLLYLPKAERRPPLVHDRVEKSSALPQRHRRLVVTAILLLALVILLSPNVDVGDLFMASSSVGIVGANPTRGFASIDRPRQ
jgi:hypothetical protein